MTSARRRVVESVLAWFGMAALASCSSSPGASGGVRQACYPNGTCNAGLVCASQICVAVGDGGADASGAAGASGTAGACGIAGAGAAGAAGAGGAPSSTGAAGAAAGTDAGAGADAAAGSAGGAHGAAGADAGIDAAACNAAPTYGDVVVPSAEQNADESAQAPGQGPTELVEWAGALSASAQPDVLDVSLYNMLQPFGDTLADGTFDLSTQGDFETCGACVVVVAKASSDQTLPVLERGDTYIATSGTLTLTAVPAFPATAQSRITGTVTNAVLVHVTIDPQSSVTTRVNDGCTVTIHSASFDSTVSD
jgi:hypothetical protein